MVEEEGEEMPEDPKPESDLLRQQQQQQQAENNDGASPKELGPGLLQCSA